MQTLLFYSYHTSTLVLKMLIHITLISEAHLYIRAFLHHVPRSRTMEDSLFHGPTFMVQILKKSMYKAFGRLTRCKPNVDQEE